MDALPYCKDIRTARQDLLRVDPGLHGNRDNAEWGQAFPKAIGADETETGRGKRG